LVISGDKAVNQNTHTMMMIHTHNYVNKFALGAVALTWNAAGSVSAGSES